MIRNLLLAIAVAASVSSGLRADEWKNQSGKGKQWKERQKQVDKHSEKMWEKQRKFREHERERIQKEREHRLKSQEHRRKAIDKADEQQQKELEKAAEREGGLYQEQHRYGDQARGYYAPGPVYAPAPAPGNYGIPNWGASPLGPPNDYLLPGHEYGFGFQRYYLGSQPPMPPPYPPEAQPDAQPGAQYYPFYPIPSAE